MLKRLILLMVAIAGVCMAEVDYREIGRRIWVNESGAQPRRLVQWDKAAHCAALGIGSNKWFPPGRSGHADEDFPKFAAFAKARGVELPTYLQGAAPWADPEDFATDSGARKEQMHKWLATHLDLQARFLIARVYAALPGMLLQSPRRDEVQKRFDELAASQQGLFCLADYYCLMGDGAKPENRSAGLLQALEEMRPQTKPGMAPAEFARASAAVLQSYAQSGRATKADAAALPAALKRCRSYGAKAR